MQRKNNILKSSRNAIAMIMAIAVILIVSGIMALSLSMTATTTKRTVDLYIYEQAVLLSKSATEYALLRIAEDGPCSHENDLNFSPNLDDDALTDDIYDINISIRYVYTQDICTNTIIVQTPEQNGSVIMDVRVSVNDEDIISEPISFFRRSIGKL
ncbi:MAG: hypothetical protein DRG78_22505 [Epsilonproteobacteria bacterium]|nr:MAG: hypothetical protein DRG78_22505 [Campylobacterota bacterium]